MKDKLDFFILFAKKTGIISIDEEPEGHLIRKKHLFS